MPDSPRRAAQPLNPEAGDIIVKVDGRNVEKSVDLPRIIGGTKPGSRSTLQVFRRGQSRDLTVTVAEFEPDRTSRKPTAPAMAEIPTTLPSSFSSTNR